MITTTPKPLRLKPRRQYATLAAEDPRREEWQRAFGTPVVPLLRGGAAIVRVGDLEALAYFVNVAGLSDEQYRTFRHFCVDEGYPEGSVSLFVSRGFAIPAEGVVVIESEEKFSR